MALLTCPTLLADSDSTNSAPQGPPPGGWHHGGPPLTQEEMQELKTAHDTALQNNPDLAAENKKLMEEMEAFHKKMDAAMIAADPNVAPLIQKMEASRKHHGDDNDGPPPPPPSDSGSN